MTKAGRGDLKDTAPEILVKTVLEGLVKKTGIKPELVEDILFGNVL